uniref:Peptidase A1 domain-containing protein n=1 Tax=Kalanchoe fedtschenkoi TaxID=63787 RepID=A0A7N0U882_KALFE
MSSSSSSSKLPFLASIIILPILISSAAAAQTSFRPKALVLPLTRDASTLQYLTHIKQRTPLVDVPLVVDLGGQNLWVDCETDYVSSSYVPVPCRSAPCSLARSRSCGDCFEGPKPGCNNNTCGVSPDNSVTRTSTSGELTQDVVSIQSTDGSTPGRAVSVPKYLFVCAPAFLLDGLASGVKGMAGLGRGKIGVPSLFAAAFSFHRKFAVCLGSNGVVIFGDGPYRFLPLPQDLSSSLTYTPLILNPVSTASSYFEGDPSTEYFIGVTSIRINTHAVPLNATLLKIDSEGNGGTKISTVNPYTVMETSLYRAVISAFRKELAEVPTVTPVAPFGLCFNSTTIGSTRVGPGVPQIDLVLQSSSVVWTIFGANSMVQVKEKVLCLGIVDGGANPRTSIVIGSHQLVDNLLQFDLADSRLGFSSTLLGRQTTCSNFNFTSTA